MASAASVLPPSNLAATAHDGGSDPDPYRVYLNGVLSSSTRSLSLWVSPASSYAVTAIQGGIESAPTITSSPAPLPPGDEGWCDPLPTTVNTSKPPFIFTGPRIECFNWIFNLMSDVPVRTNPAPIVREVHDKT